MNPPLSDREAIFQDAPSNDKLEELGKADAVYPKQFSELLAVQSPVRNQARRGVCSIFSTVGLMEHLYVKEGTLSDPDFSEQYLQWSVKFEVKSFPNTSGSNANSNLQAINRFGIVEEDLWPYEGSQWGTSNDSACDGSDSQPTRCYTNGEPPDNAKNGEKWFLPAGRWINSTDRSIKAHLTTKKTAVIVGLDFFYQAWNHGRSTIPVDNNLFKQGFVTNPNAKDVEESHKHSAGHSILIVGWDDDVTAPMRDGEGKPLLDAAGNPQLEKGFFIFKNSWGTGSFGVESPFGAGYGYLSMQYVKDYGTAYVSDVPKLELPPEICNDGIDNDRDKASDCDDSDCASDAACNATPDNYENTTPQPIPDNNKTGIQSQIVVPTGGNIEALSVSVDITHTYRGDLSVKLVREDGSEAILHNRAGGSADDLKQTFAVTAFDGQDAAGTWTLIVSDSANVDTGTLNSWKLDITRCSGASCMSSGPQVYENTSSVMIPDNDPKGIQSDIDVPDAGAMKSLSVSVDITHTYKGDLRIKLQRLGLGETVLLEPDASDGNFGTRTFSVSSFLGDDSKGTWRLIVADEASQDIGTLNSWKIEVGR